MRMATLSLEVGLCGDLGMFMQHADTQAVLICIPSEGIGERGWDLFFKGDLVDSRARQKGQARVTSCSDL